MNKNKNDSKSFSSFQLRLLLAVLMLAGYILMEKNDIEVAEINARKIAAMISADIEDSLEVLAEKIR